MESKRAFLGGPAGGAGWRWAVVSWVLFGNCAGCAGCCAGGGAFARRPPVAVVVVATGEESLGCLLAGVSAIARGLAVLCVFVELILLMLLARRAAERVWRRLAPFIRR